MKCRSVACIWSARPPFLHQITSAVVLNDPPTLYTGGADGSIFWWNLSGPKLQLEIKPIAMLCGHAMPIADLAICQPSIVLGDGNTDHSSKSLVNSAADSYGALISACTDGVLCVWSRGSGHCRRRRKLAPWIGSPSIICTLPSNPRYVCIGCSFNDVDGSVRVDEDLQNKKLPKCTVVIVDTYTLVTVQTIFHGNILNGSPKFMSILLSPEDREKHMLALVDHYGRMLLVPILKDSHFTGSDGRDMQKNESHSKMFLRPEAFGEGFRVLSCASEENVIALLTHDRCIYSLLDSGVIIGEVCFAGDSFSQDTNNKAYFTGCTFLKSNDKQDMFDKKDEAEGFKRKIIIWDNKGFAVVYLISYSRSLFTSEPLCSIPAASHFGDMRMSIRFLELNGCLLRTESFCFHFKEPLQWRSRVTIWSTRNNHGGMKSYQQCEKVAEDNSFADWMAEFASVSKGGKDHGSEEQSRVDSTSMLQAEDIQTKDRVNDSLRGIVSSSMVISEFLQAPHAIVYGYLNGEIELVKFDVLQLLDSQGEISYDGVHSNVSRQHFRGHTDAIVCLASHEMLGSVHGCNFSHVLISGSTDCTIRIWDLDGGSILRVLHQHVSPIRKIILPPSKTEHPWNNCFLSIGDDSCVALVSLQTLRVERMFPGHHITPTKVVWEGVRGYLACLCQTSPRASDANDLLYIWDIKTGARERILRGTASHSMFDRFCSASSMNSSSGSMSSRNTSASSLVVPISEDFNAKSYSNASVTGSLSLKNVNEHGTHKAPGGKDNPPILSEVTPSVFQNIEDSISCCCPFPGVATLIFDLTSLMLPFPRYEFPRILLDKKHNIPPRAVGGEDSSCFNVHKMSTNASTESEWTRSCEELMVCFSLSFLHSWGVDKDLDQLLISNMNLKRSENLIITSGMVGDKGALTLVFPGINSVLELWKLSSEFCAMRSLTMVSLAQRMVSLCHSSSGVSSALAAFYTRHFMEKVPDIKPPSLQLLVSFWQDDSEHVRMAARSMFHCAASSRSIPLPLCSGKNIDHIKFISSLAENSGNGHNNPNEETDTEKLEIQQFDDSKVLAWLESYELQDWISCVGGTSQDAMTSHIIVAAALAIWYPSLVKPTLATLVVHHLVKLVMAMNEKYSSTAAELLSEGMESTWKACLGSEIPRLIGDIFFQIECVSSTSASPSANPAASNTIRDTLVGILLPSLAMADVHGFLATIESQIWSTASDSPVHLVALAILIRVLRGAPKSLTQYLDKVINFILQTMDPSNLVMRKTCLHSSMAVLKEIARVLPMVALNETSTRLAVGDAIGEINNASIRVYDMQSVAKIKVLDANAPLALPSLLVGESGMTLTTVISALCFSQDGEGLVAFSEHGLMIRWWSLGSGWWERLNRNYVPVQCTKLIFVPPWEGFSPKAARTSVMANILGPDGQISPRDNSKGVNEVIHNLDISYRLEWVGDRKVLLTRHGQELGTFQL